MKSSKRQRTTTTVIKAWFEGRRSARKSAAVAGRQDGVVGKSKEREMGNFWWGAGLAREEPACTAEIRDRKCQNPIFENPYFS
jgi:hypothetical protein